jgi:hypothetical protein
MLKKIISGGQTGVDIAALRAAKAVGLETGGWMPKGFKTEDGPRSEYADLYGMQEANRSDYPTRTRLNVAESPLTLFIGPNHSSAGAMATRSAVLSQSFKTIMFIRFPLEEREYTTGWLAREIRHTEIVNIAGNRDTWLETPIEEWLIEVFREVLRLQGEQAAN